MKPETLPMPAHPASNAVTGYRRDTTVRASCGILLAVFVVLLMATSPSTANDFDAARAASSAGRHEQAATMWRALAERGDARGQYVLGDLYFQGQGVERNLTESTYWFRKAAEQGHALAEFNLGNAYRLGHGVEQDQSKAVVWWRRAARQDVAAAQFSLALSYYLGHGVAKDNEASNQWLNRAAANGHARAQAIIKGAAPGTSAKTVDSANSPGTSKSLAIRVPGTDPLRWLHKQHPGHYTVQLLVSSSAARADDFIRKHAFANQTVSLKHVTTSGKSLYTVVHGSYISRASALSAIERLPVAIQKIKPFARRFSSLQSQIGAEKKSGTAR